MIQNKTNHKKTHTHLLTNKNMFAGYLEDVSYYPDLLDSIMQEEQEEEEEEQEEEEQEEEEEEEEGECFGDCFGS